MPEVMIWEKLLSPERERPSKGGPHIGEHRNCFDMDYDRIVYSSSIRRLQDKAQVFPLQENDFTRTRLTHSLETSAIGRSLGTKIGLWLKDNEPDFDPAWVTHISSLLTVAGLVHDLGNPPFGHYGEEVIKNWFHAHAGGQVKSLAPDELSDFTLFDGNAQTLRILGRLQFLTDRHGINFCFGTLGTLLKYPWGSSNPKAAEKTKFGFFKSESDLAARIIEATGMISRHPVTYLLEAADDIAYLFADIEDAVKKRHLPWNEVYRELIKDDALWKHFPGNRASLEKDMNRLADSKVPNEEKALIGSQYFKITGQVMCISAVYDEFTTQYRSIMYGNYPPGMVLLKSARIRPFVERVRDICIQYAYQNKEVLTLEMIGKSALTTLLDKFINAVLDERSDDLRTDSGKLRALISRNFDYVQRLDQNSIYQAGLTLSPYQRVQLVIDFISGMTDSYALGLHKKLMGVDLP